MQVWSSLCRYSSVRGPRKVGISLLPGMVEHVPNQASNVSSPPVEISSSPCYEEEVETTDRWDRSSLSSQSLEYLELTLTPHPASVANEFSIFIPSAAQIELKMHVLMPEVSISTLPPTKYLHFVDQQLMTKA